MIADILLEIGAVKLDPENLSTWTSGIKSPIYCDNRQIISHPAHRKEVVKKFCERVRELKNIELIAGTATAGIPWAAWIAHELELPMVYARADKKSHGLQNAIEGAWSPGQKAVVIEDLISTGKSSLEAVDKLASAQIEVIEVQSIFTYGFDSAGRNFKNAQVPFHSLETLDTLLESALKGQLLSERQVGIIREWKQNIAQN